MYLLSEDLSIQDQSKSWGTAFSQTEVLAEAIVPFLRPPPTDPQVWKAGTTLETPSTWLSLFAPPW